MKDLELVGIDLAKNVFQLHGCSTTGEVGDVQSIKTHFSGRIGHLRNIYGSLTILIFTLPEGESIKGKYQ